MVQRHFPPMSLQTLLLCLACLFLGDSSVLPIATASEWKVVRSPNKTNSNYLYAVTANSASDAWAVGSAYNSSIQNQLTLVEHWKGTSWAIVPSPNPGTAKFCGFQDYAGNYLYGVAAISTNDVWAVGEICPYGVGQTLAEHWNGTQWTLMASPSEPGAENSTLVAVAAVSGNDVWTVGNYQVGGGAYQWNTLIEHWDWGTNRFEVIVSETIIF